MATHPNLQVMSPTELEEFSSLLEEKFDVSEVKAEAKKGPSDGKQG